MRGLISQTVSPEDRRAVEAYQAKIDDDKVRVVMIRVGRLGIRSVKDKNTCVNIYMGAEAIRLNMSLLLAGA